MGEKAKRRWGSFAVTYGRERTKNRLSEFVGLRISNEEEYEGGVEAIFRFQCEADFGGTHILLADVILMNLVHQLVLYYSPEAHFAVGLWLEFLVVVHFAH